VIQYAINILKKRWIKAEPMLLQQANAEQLYDYTARFFGKGRGWPEAAARLAESNDPIYIIQYARHVVERRLPEYEPKILEKIKKLLTKKKISQHDFANLLYFSQYVKHLAPDWEEGRAVFPTLKKLINVGSDRHLLALPPLELSTLREANKQL
jgi:DNA-binding transcriptional regulator YiaG